MFRGRFIGRGGKGLGPGGKCVCRKCGYSVPHKRGVPCFKLRCPNCGSKLERV